MEEMMQKTARQQNIVNEAFTLIANQGIQELTIKNLAKAIGTSEPAIYRHFDSKAAILSAIVDEIIAVRNAALRQTINEKQSTRERLMGFFLHQARTFESFPSLTIILFPDMLFRQDPDLLARIHLMIKETNDRIDELLETGVKEGSFKKDLDIGSVSLLLIGGFRMLVSGWRMKDALRDGSTSLVEHTQRYISSTLRLLTGS